MRTVQEALDLSRSLGFAWSEKDAQEFLAYNIDKGRKDGWGYAAQRWEANRAKREKQDRKRSASPENASKYLCLVNRFKEE